MNNINQANDSVTFHPVKVASDLSRFSMSLVAIAIFVTVGVFVFTMKSTMLPVYLITPICISLLWPFLKYILNGLQGKKLSFRCDSLGITEISSKGEKTIQWSEITDIECYNASSGVGELRVKLITNHEDKPLIIETEKLDRGGLGLVEVLFRKRQDIFEKRSKEYLEGRVQWNFSFIKPALKLEGNMLHVEFPKNKRFSIPLTSLNRIEWVPGVLSGAEKGFVRIDHHGGSIKLPQGVAGIQYFLYTLKYTYGLYNKVNPVRSREFVEQLDKLHDSLWKKYLLRYAGFVIILAMLIRLIGASWGYLEDSQTRKIGETTTATITEKQDKLKIKLSYTAGPQDNQETKVRVKPDFYNSCKVNDKLEIKFNPILPTNVYFTGKTSWDNYSYTILAVSVLALIFLGIIFLILGCWRWLESKHELKELLISEPQHLEPLQQEIPYDHTMPLAPNASVTSHAQPAYSYDQHDLDTAQTTAFSRKTIQTDESTMANAVTPPPGTQFSIAAPQSQQPLEPQPNTIPTLPKPNAAIAPPPPPSSVLNSGENCSSCNQPLTGEFFLCNGAKWCPDCRNQGAPRVGCWLVLRAFFLGTGAALLGSAIWAGIVLATGYELGIIAIIVGLLVGYGVKLGAKNAGGLTFQFMAVILTFFCLSYSLIPIMINEFKNEESWQKFEEAFERGWNQQMKKQSPEEQKEMQDILDKLKQGNNNIEENNQDENVADEEEFENDEAAQDIPLPAPEEPSGGDILMGIGAMILLFCLLILIVIFGPPLIYLVYLISSPFSIIFLAIALWESWRLNKREELVFQGPFNNNDTMNFDQPEYTS